MQRFKHAAKRGPALLIWMLAALLLAGCENETGSTPLGGGEDDAHDHEEHSDHPGRLAILSRDGAGDQLYAYDLEAQALLPGSLALNNAPSALATSPGKRFVLAMQRNANQVQIIDGGLYRHDDHVDEVAPSLVGTLTGPRPNHYRAHGEQAALFYDGDAGSALMAQVQVLTDHSLESASMEAEHTLASAHHGVAEPRGEILLATQRTADSGPPKKVEILHLHGDHYHGEGTISPDCPDLHGAGSNEQYSVFGCSNGILIVHQDGDTFTAQHVDNATLGLTGSDIGPIHLGEQTDDPLGKELLQRDSHLFSSKVFDVPIEHTQIDLDSVLLVMHDPTHAEIESRTDPATLAMQMRRIAF